jgi:hypothetical protein
MKQIRKKIFLKISLLILFVNSISFCYSQSEINKFNQKNISIKELSDSVGMIVDNMSIENIFDLYNYFNNKEIEILTLIMEKKDLKYRKTSFNKLTYSNNTYITDSYFKNTFGDTRGIMFTENSVELLIDRNELTDNIIKMLKYSYLKNERSWTSYESFMRQFSCDKIINLDKLIITTNNGDSKTNTIRFTFLK